jgi:outer membrane murein-binding lipoprotein Lpp
MANLRKVVAVFFVVAPVLLAGCATTADLEKVRATADQANATAQRAAQTADEAKTMASQAAQKAEDAQTCCNHNTERLNRMFRKSMYK